MVRDINDKHWNFYILLELSPSTTSDYDHHKAIERKQKEWQIASGTDYLSAAYNAMLPEIKRVMSSVCQERKLEADAAQRIIRDTILNDCKVLEQRGTITPQQIDHLAKVHNVEKDFVLNCLPASIKTVAKGTTSHGSRKSDCLSPRLNPTTARQVDNCLFAVGKRNLYDFLDLPQGGSCQELRGKADRLLESYNKRPRTPQVEAAKNLAALAGKVFGDEASKSSYDNHLAWQGLRSIWNQIDLTAAEGTISPHELRVVYRLLLDLGHSPEQSVGLIEQYCAENRYVVSLTDIMDEPAPPKPSAPTPPPAPRPQRSRFRMSGVLIALLIFALAYAGLQTWSDRYRASLGPTAIFLDGEQVVFGDAKPEMISDTLFASARAIADAMGAKVSWKDSTGTLTITRGSRSIIFVMDSTNCKVDGQPVVLADYPRVINGRAMVPVTPLVEAFGYSAEWRRSENALHIKREGP